MSADDALHFGLTDYAAVKDEVRAVLIHVARQQRTVGYAEFCRLLTSATLHHRNPALYQLLRDVCHDEHVAGRPNLCALVVRASDGLPGQGFFVTAAQEGHNVSDPHAFWARALAAVFDYWGEAQAGGESA